MNRREFLATSAATATVATLPHPGFTKDSAPMIPVIDTHQHLWDLSRFRLAWLKKGEPLDASFTPKEYAAATAGLNVVKAVYMEVDVVPEQQKQEVDYITELCQSGQTPTCAAVVSGRPESEGFAAYVRPFQGHKYIKGIRRLLHVESTPAGYCLQPRFVQSVQLLGELGLSFDLCIRWAELPDMIKLVDQCPGTRFILDHCGNPKADFTAAERETWRKNLGQLAERKNVVCKVSGFLANGWKPGQWKPEDIRWAVFGPIEAFGWDRVLFGGDWPVVTLAGTYKDWLTALRQLIADKPAADQKKLLHDNAAKFYGI
ncbi:MAG: amidohydrolase family protein [Bacteroidales bacterium]|nr:amidohydrolase family protein [Bacteroidales bacterium]